MTGENRVTSFPPAAWGGAYLLVAMKSIPKVGELIGRHAALGYKRAAQAESVNSFGKSGSALAKYPILEAK
jgi:hypothetical protein